MKVGAVICFTMAALNFAALFAAQGGLTIVFGLMAIGFYCIGLRIWENEHKSRDEG